MLRRLRLGLYNLGTIDITTIHCLREKCCASCLTSVTYLIGCCGIIRNGDGCLISMSLGITSCTMLAS